jgi:hypothetical protein
MNVELSAFYFDIRKDALYCDPREAEGRAAGGRHLLQGGGHLARADPRLHQRGGVARASVWRREHDFADDWAVVRDWRSVVTSALEIERAAKRIGSSLDARVAIHVDDQSVGPFFRGLDWAELCITSGAELVIGKAPEGAFRLAGNDRVGVEVMRPLGVTSPGVDHYQPEPDVSVIDTDTDEVRYVQRAILVAEVVSPTNRMSLIKKKVGFYRTLQLCRAVIVVEPKRIEAKVHVRSDAWAERVLPGAEARLALPEFGVDFPLSALYARTSLARRSGQATS